MEFLLTKNPQFSGKFESREVKDFYKDLVEDADQFTQVSDLDFKPFEHTL